METVTTRQEIVGSSLDHKGKHLFKLSQRTRNGM